MTKAERAKVIAYVAARNQYDPATVRIMKNGDVTARKDQNKTMKYDNGRYLVGFVNDILAAEHAKA